MAARLLRSKIYQSAETLLCYMSYADEADTKEILYDALRAGKRVYLPYCVPGTNQLEFYRIAALSELRADAFGIPAPTPDPEKRFVQESNVLCIVPGLAFSPKGERMGYGRGYYDTFLEDHAVCTLGLCYGFQVIPTVPVEPHDRTVRYLCTESGVFEMPQEIFEFEERTFEL